MGPSSGQRQEFPTIKLLESSTAREPSSLCPVLLTAISPGQETDKLARHWPWGYLGVDVFENVLRKKDLCSAGPVLPPQIGTHTFRASVSLFNQRQFCPQGDI